MKKLHFFIGTGLTVGLLLVGISFVHAQGVPITGYIPQEGSAPIPMGGYYNCNAVDPSYINSSTYAPPANFLGASPGDNNPVKIPVNPDGDEYSISGSYTAVKPDCLTLPSDQRPLCQDLSDDFETAVQAANLQSGFPQGTVTQQGANSGYSSNTVSLQFAAGVCGTRNGLEVTMCEKTITFPNTNGGNDVFSYIYFDTNGLSNPATSGEGNGSDLQGNTAFGVCTLAHELTHTFGPLDIYNIPDPNNPGSNINYSGLMGSECSNIYQGTTPDKYPNYWSPNELATVAWLNAKKPLVVDISTCGLTCDAGFDLVFTQKTTGSPFIAQCEPNTDTAGDKTECNCNTSTPYCDDLEQEQLIPPPTADFCAAQNKITCTCQQDKPVCVDGNGQSVVPGAFTNAFLCDAPPDQVCTCTMAGGSTPINADCHNTNDPDTPVAIPGGYCTAPPSTTIGGYACMADDTCQYVEDATGVPTYSTAEECAQKCGSQGGGDFYECDPDTNQCVYDAFGGSYPDSTCGGGACGQ